MERRYRERVNGKIAALRHLLLSIVDDLDSTAACEGTDLQSLSPTKISVITTAINLTRRLCRERDGTQKQNKTLRQKLVAHQRTTIYGHYSQVQPIGDSIHVSRSQHSLGETIAEYTAVVTEIPPIRNLHIVNIIISGIVQRRLKFLRDQHHDPGES